ncbi:DNA mismatch repair protein Msh6 [Gigaspora margarita]|uniref:DNA mismatch repair protein Msh6 n=1 Tax=Gigaspora margarita TaxID=4874 RepID=A0A8H4EF61_GIGMA|nr:DNA mismatch repair protein Msh6 [Gigaspora margarita]
MHYYDQKNYLSYNRSHVGTENAPSAFGICFVDTATAEFHLASFLDDVDRTQFETLIMLTKPNEIIYEKGMLSQLSKCDCINRPIWTALKPESKFWDANTTRSQIRMSRHFSNNRNASIAQNETLANLEVLENSLDESTQGTVFQLLSRCITPFGKLSSNVCHPLRDIAAINAWAELVGRRPDAIRNIYHHEIESLVAHLFSQKMDISSRISSYFSNTEIEAWDYMGCLEYLAKTNLFDGLMNATKNFANATESLVNAKETLY